MECNRDEALRAKTISEEKLEKKDFAGAKKFAMKAQTLYPGLDGISQMLTTIDVYVSAENKISGEMDWYGVLNVNPSADEDTIKKHYRKLALVLHPDKNKSVGADGAFRLISEAWTFLSDKDKRFAYNQRRGFRGFQQKVPLHATGQSQTASSRPNGVHNFGNRTTSAPKVPTTGQTAQSGNRTTQVPKAAAQSQPNGTHNVGAKTTSVPKAQSNGTKKPAKGKPTPPRQKPENFWTMCNHCKFHYEFVRMYLNGTLLCPTCKKAFIAKETDPPPGYSSSKVPHQQKQASGDNAPNENGHDPGKNVPEAKKPRPGPDANPHDSEKNIPSAKKPRPNPNPPDSGKNVTAAKKSGTGSNQNAHDSGKNVPSAKKTGPGPNQNAHDPGKNVPSAKKSGPGPNQNAHDPEKNIPSAKNSGPGPNQNVHDPGKDVQAGNKSGPGQAGLNSVRNANQEKVPLSGTANVGSRDHAIGAKAATVAQQALNKLKRAYAEANAPVGLQEQIKKTRLDDDSSRNKMNHNMAHTNGGFGTESASRINVFSGIPQQPNSTRDVSPLEYQKIMMAKSQKDIRSKLNTWKSEEGFNSTSSTERNDKNDKSDLSTNGSVGKTSKTAAIAMTVPDPDFHDFDNDRTELSFGDNEVWSAYDDKGGMPRLYALIHKVNSRKPFKLTISWLNSKTNAEFSSMDWVSSGFHKTCGEFWVGKYEPFKSINAFSQKVNWSKSKRGCILIFPQKDEVWALYKNWSSEWDKRTPNDVVQKYDMVMVLDDYNKENGISVAPLVKLAGFKTVFHPELDPRVIKRVPKEEMFRFSHRVPHHVLTGQEAENAPKGCLELDPAATSLELLRVITEANKDPVIPG